MLVSGKGGGKSLRTAMLLLALGLFAVLGIALTVSSSLSLFPFGGTASAGGAISVGLSIQSCVRLMAREHRRMVVFAGFY